MKSDFNKVELGNYRKILRKTQTTEELLLWKQLKSKRLLGEKFFRQYSVGPYILDFYCPRLRLAVELDGGHHSQEKQREYDNNRSFYLSSKNIKVLRFWNNEVKNNLEGVLEILRREIVMNPLLG